MIPDQLTVALAQNPQLLARLAANTNDIDMQGIRDQLPGTGPALRGRPTQSQIKALRQAIDARTGRQNELPPASTVNTDQIVANHVDRNYGGATGLDAANMPTYARNELRRRMLSNPGMIPGAQPQADIPAPGYTPEQQALAAQMAAGQYQSKRYAQDQAQNATLKARQPAVANQRRLTGAKKLEAMKSNFGLAERRDVLNPSAKRWAELNGIMPDSKLADAANAAMIAGAGKGALTVDQVLAKHFEKNPKALDDFLNSRMNQMNGITPEVAAGQQSAPVAPPHAPFSGLNTATGATEFHNGVGGSVIRTPGSEAPDIRLPSQGELTVKIDKDGNTWKRDSISGNLTVYDRRGKPLKTIRNPGRPAVIPGVEFPPVQPVPGLPAF